MGENRFNDCTNVIELMHQIVGAASMSWEHVERAGVFDEQAALCVVNEGLFRLQELDAIQFVQQEN